MSPHSEGSGGQPNHYVSASSQYASSVGSARSERSDPMHEFMEIAKQTRLMALATQGELVTTHSHIKRFERLLDTEREARQRFESEVQNAMSDTRRTIHSLREELAALASTIYKISPHANPSDVMFPLTTGGMDVEPWARDVDAEIRRISEPAVKLIQVELRKIDGKLGVGLGGGNSTQPLFIHTLTPGSAAYLDGRLAIGDRILKIDGFHVDRASYEGAVALLRTTDDVVVFEVARTATAEKVTAPQEHEPELPKRKSSQAIIRPVPVKPLSTEGETITIELTKDAHGLGFTVAGVENTATEDGVSCGIFVDRIHDNGVAGVDGRLRIGDQVAAVDGQTLSGRTHVACMNILRSTGKTVQLVVLRSKQPVVIPRANSETVKPVVKVEHSRSASEKSKQDSTDMFYPPRSGERQSPEDLSPKPPMASSPNKPKPETKKALPLETYKSKFPGMKIILIALNKGDSGLGLGIRGGTSTSQTQGIYVESIVEGGTAQLDGGLRIKDRLLAVNEVDLTEASKSEAIKVLKNAGDKVMMIIARAKPSAEPTTHM